jgi:hypothetical protein
MGRSRSLRGGGSCEADLPLVLTGVSTLLLSFQVLRWSESNIRTNMANICKKLAESG